MNILIVTKLHNSCNQTANIDLKLTLTSVILKDQHVREIREKITSRQLLFTNLGKT